MSPIIIHTSSCVTVVTTTSSTIMIAPSIIHFLFTIWIFTIPKLYTIIVYHSFSRLSTFRKEIWIGIKIKIYW